MRRAGHGTQEGRHPSARHTAKQPEPDTAQPKAQPKLSRSGSSCSSGGRAGRGSPAGRPCASGRGRVTSGAAGCQPEGSGRTPRTACEPAGGHARGGEGGRAARRALLAREVADPGEANHHEVQRAEVALHVRRQQVVDHPALRPLPGFSSELVHGLGLREARRHHRLAFGRARL